MISIRTLATSAVFAVLFSGPTSAQELASYRDFEFRMSLESVAKQVKMKPSDVKTIHQRPELIQTLDWDQAGYLSLAPTASLRSIRFDFYNDELFKMVVTYNPAETEGLTEEDMIEAISARYGQADTRAKTVQILRSTAYEDDQKVLACWEDAQYSYNLFRASYGNAFGLVAFYKPLNLMAMASSREADRLDKLEAPGKELLRQMKQVDDKRVAQEKARLINKPKFKP